MKPKETLPQKSVFFDIDDDKLSIEYNENEWKSFWTAVIDYIEVIMGHWFYPNTNV